MRSSIEPNVFVKPDGSLWLGVEYPKVQLEKVIKNKLPLSRAQKTSIGVLTTNVKDRYSVTTYLIHPIQFLKEEMEELLEILRVNKTELKKQMVLVSAQGG